MQRIDGTEKKTHPRMRRENVPGAVVSASLVLSMALFACGSSSKEDAGTGDASVEDAETYVDQCTDDAPCSLTVGVQASDYLAPVGDSDAWHFDVAEAGKILDIVVQNDVEFTPIRLQVVLLGPAGAAVAGPENFSGNGKQRIEMIVKASVAGQYTIVVREVGNDAQDRRNPYYITVKVLSESDDNEPNETPATATPLTPGQGAHGTIAIQGDQDWFKIEAPAHALLHIELAAQDRGDSPVRFRWELWGLEAAERLAESDEPAAGTAWPAENRSVGADAGTYYVKVMDWDGDGAQADGARIYQLTVTLETEPDEHDLAGPNEVPSSATAVQDGVAVTGYIAATGDQDYYRIRVSAASEASPKLIVVEASMAGASDVDLAFTVFGTNGKTEVCQARDDDYCYASRFFEDGSVGAAHLRTSHVVTAPGDYFVLVRDFQDNDYDTATPYQLFVSLPADPDTHENYKPDDRTSAIRVGTTTGTVGATIEYQWVEGYISYANDIDWYRFDLPGGAGLPATQNGDWLIEITLEMGLDGPGGALKSTPVELEAFFYGQDVSYGGYGKRCREPSPSDPHPCQFDDASNPLKEQVGEAEGDCFVVFRERTSAGPHYFRFSDLDRDDFDNGPYGKYRLKVKATAGCPGNSVCTGIYTNSSGSDLCGRP